MDFDANTAQRYVFEIARPLGWHVPQVIPPSGAMLLTVGGLPPSEAPASIMVRPVPKGADSLETFFQRELDALLHSFTEPLVQDAEAFDFAGHAWMGKSIRSTVDSRVASLTVLEEGDHFIWFGLLVSDKRQWRKAPRVYRRVVQSFREQRYSELVTALHGT